MWAPSKWDPKDIYLRIYKSNSPSRTGRPRHSNFQLPRKIVVAVVACAGPGEMEDEQAAGVDGAADDHLLDWLHRSYFNLPDQIYDDDPYTTFPDDPWSWDVALPHALTSIPPPLPATSSGDPPNLDRPKTSVIVASPAKEDRSHGKRSRAGTKRARPRNSGGSNSGGSSGGGGGNKEARWAEKLLNPCATAIAAGNLSRAQHLIYVLDELASFSGDANYRLAAHGLQALSRHVPPQIAVGASSAPAPTFATSDLKRFHDSLLRFHENSPWFSFPNTVANAAILQALAADPSKGAALHIVDIGISHGVQWPTLLEALTRRPAGKPAAVRLTVVPPAATDLPVPFSIAPPGHDFANSLLLFADKLHLNLQIQRRSAQTLASEFSGGDGGGDETVVVCAQFRLHHLRHHPHNEDGDGEGDDDRTAFLRRLAEGVRPDLMVLSEYEGECGCQDCAGDFAAGFGRRVEFVRRFLEAASAAFKGRKSEERRVVEGEAATALVAAAGEMREGRERWCRRMSAAGFAAVGVSDEAVDGGRALLRKHDGGWEMKVEGGGDGPISLLWKGQPILFVSLWRPIKHS